MRFILSFIIAFAPMLSHATRGAQPNPQAPTKVTHYSVPKAFMSVMGPATVIMSCVVGRPDTECVQGPSFLNVDLERFGNELLARGHGEQVARNIITTAGISAALAVAYVGITALTALFGFFVAPSSFAGDVAVAVWSFKGITTTGWWTIAAAVAGSAMVSIVLNLQAGSEVKRIGRSIKNLAARPDTVVQISVQDLQLYMRDLRPIPGPENFEIRLSLSDRFSSGRSEAIGFR